MTEDTSPENLRKFLESDDPALVRMGLSMAKGSGVPDELLGEILWLYMMHDDKAIRAAANSLFMKKAPEDTKQFMKKWKEREHILMKLRTDFNHYTDEMGEELLDSLGMEAVKNTIILADKTGIGYKVTKKLCEPMKYINEYPNPDNSEVPFSWYVDIAFLEIVVEAIQEIDDKISFDSYCLLTKVCASLVNDFSDYYGYDWEDNYVNYGEDKDRIFNLALQIHGSDRDEWWNDNEIPLVEQGSCKACDLEDIRLYIPKDLMKTEEGKFVGEGEDGVCEDCFDTLEYEE